MTVTPTTSTQGSLNVGDTWEVGVSVKTPKGALTDAVVTAVVTSPISADYDVAMERTSTGKYVARWILDMPGRYTITITAEGHGTEGFTITSKAATAELPSASDVRTYMGESGIAYDSERLDDALAAEMAAQAAACKIGANYSADLREALLRRVHRNLAMRNIPLGVQQDEAGGTRIGSVDPEVRRLEGPYRKRVVG